MLFEFPSGSRDMKEFILERSHFLASFVHLPVLLNIQSPDMRKFILQEDIQRKTWNLKWFIFVNFAEKMLLDRILWKFMNKFTWRMERNHFLVNFVHLPALLNIQSKDMRKLIVQEDMKWKTLNLKLCMGAFSQLLFFDI